MAEIACRYCGETVLAVAKKCKHCGEWLDERGRGASRAQPVRWEGDLLVIAKETLLPDEACWVCGGREGVTARRRQFTFTPGWVYFGLLGGLIPLIILAAIGQKRGRLDVPVCGSCHWRSVAVDAGLFLFVLVGLFAAPGGFGWLGSLVDRNVGWIVGMIFGFAALVAGVAAFKVYVARRMQITCDRIEGEAITLRVPQPELIRDLLARDG